MEKNPEDVVANNTETNNSANANANDSRSEVKQEASTSSAVFNRSKKNVKRRSYRQKNAHSDGNDSSSSSIDENDKPGSTTSNLNTSEEQSKQKRLQEPEDNAKSPSPQTTKRQRMNPPADDSDTSYNVDSDHETDTETSDDWTMSKEEKWMIPEVLNKIKPKPTLNIIKEIVQRQTGRGVQFERKFYGSLYMVERLQYSHSLSDHQDGVGSIQFNAKGDLVSGSDDLTVIVWNWATGKKSRSYISGHQNEISQASWLPRDDSSMMVTCATDGQVRLLDLNSGSTRKLAAHRGTCYSFTIHPDYPHVAMSVGDDGQVLSIDVRDGETTKLVVPKNDDFPIELFTIHSHPQNSNEFCIGGRTEFVRIYDRRKAHKPIMHLRPKNASERVYITAVTYNYNGTEVLASYNNDDIYLFDTLLPHPDGDYAHKYQGHLNNKTIKGVNYFGPKSEFIVSGSDCGSMFIWEKNTEAIVQYLPADAQGMVSCVKPHPHIPALVSSGLDNDVKIWVPSAADPPSALSGTGVRSSVLSNMRNRMYDEVAYDSRRSNLFCVLLDLFVKSNARWSETSSDEDGDD